eukprot:15485012-Alexandrium_andersonii.AAC.1
MQCTCRRAARADRSHAQRARPCQVRAPHATTTCNHCIIRNLPEPKSAGRSEEECPGTEGGSVLEGNQRGCEQDHEEAASASADR